MELEEMQTLWSEMSRDIEKQKTLTDKLILKMIQINYRNKLNKILIPETINAFLCLAMVIVILFYFPELNTWYLQAGGIITVLIFILLPILSISAIRAVKSINISANNYKQTLSLYSKAKLRFVSVQKLSIYLGFLLTLAALPVATKIMDGKDIFSKPSYWLLYALVFPFFYFASRRVYKCYVNTVTDAENILKELDA